MAEQQTRQRGEADPTSMTALMGLSGTVRRDTQPDEHHGSSPAAWTLVAIVLAAFVVGTIAMCIGPNWLLFWISCAVAVVGLIVGKVMGMMGMRIQHDKLEKHDED